MSETAKVREAEMELEDALLDVCPMRRGECGGCATRLHIAAMALLDSLAAAPALAEENERLERVREAAAELLEVAQLRGDNELPHPCDDAKLWTARMQDAWVELDDALTLAAAPAAEAKDDRCICGHEKHVHFHAKTGDLMDCGTAGCKCSQYRPAFSAPAAEAGRTCCTHGPEMHNSGECMDIKCPCQGHVAAPKREEA
jgi:hypothetical protein